MNDKVTLNILNGQSMFDYFKRHNLNNNGFYAPFNEAMCTGKGALNIFSEEFVKCRCITHHITAEKYNEVTLLPLKVLFENRFSSVILWFDDDMFCQINLLTLLAYLEQVCYNGDTTFNLVNHEFEVVNSIKLDIQGYCELYKQVMIDRCMPPNIKLPTMKNGIKLYFEYLKQENEITSYISQRPDLPSDILLKELLERFRLYGLGDTQYIELIRKFRKYN